MTSIPPTTSGRPKRRPSPTDRLGRTLRWLRWPVVVIWLLAIVALNPLASSLPKVTNNSASAYLPSSAESTKVAELEQSAQHGPGQPDVDPVVVVFARDTRLSSADTATVSSAHAAVARLSRTVRGLSAPGKPIPSADGKAVYFTATVTAPSRSETSYDTAAVQRIRHAVARAASRAGPGLQTEVTGSAATVTDSVSATRR